MLNIVNIILGLLLILRQTTPIFNSSQEIVPTNYLDNLINYFSK